MIYCIPAHWWEINKCLSILTCKAGCFWRTIFTNKNKKATYNIYDGRTERRAPQWFRDTNTSTVIFVRMLTDVPPTYDQILCSNPWNNSGRGRGPITFQYQVWSFLAGGSQSGISGGCCPAVIFPSLLIDIWRDDLRGRWRGGWCWTDGNASISRGKVGSLHWVQAVDGVPRPSLQQAHICSGQEAIAWTRQRGVTVKVVHKGVSTWWKWRRHEEVRF